MSFKPAVIAIVVIVLLNIGRLSTCVSQEAERDPGQASVSLRGVVSDVQVTLKMNWHVAESTEGNSQSKDLNVQEAKDYPLEAFLIPSK